MRIAYISADFGVPILGRKGASVHVRRLTGALAERGHEVLVLTPVRDEAPPPPAPDGGTEAPAGVGIVEIAFSTALDGLYEALKQEEIARGTRLPKDLRNLLYAPHLEGKAAALLEAQRPDLLYERYSLFGTAGVQLAERLGVPLLLEVNAPLVEEQQEQRGLSLPHVARALQRSIFSRADEILVVSGWLRDYVIAAGAHPQRVTVVPNAADTDLFRPGGAAQETRRRLDWDDRFVIGFVGSMKSWHGVPSLLEAMKHLGAPRSDFRLLLVGDGPELARMQESVAAEGLGASVHVTGAVPHDAVPRWLDAMDVAVVPYAATAAEYFSPIKLFECMAMARPVVAARVGQVADIIEEGRTGWLYPAGDAALLAERILWLSQNPAAAAAAGDAARRKVLGDHTWQRNAERVEALAHRALGRRGG